MYLKKVLLNYYKIKKYVKEEGSKRNEFAAYVSGLYIYIPAGVLTELRTENLESCETVKARILSHVSISAARCRVGLLVRQKHCFNLDI